ncbi:MAG: hypothetical protein E8D42_07405 [Nitrospira sp.]|nr:MAG: hypothetical protein E8D42_07405 [Nitrospira sp.]
MVKLADWIVVLPNFNATEPLVKSSSVIVSACDDPGNIQSPDSKASVTVSPERIFFEESFLIFFSYPFWPYGLSVSRRPARHVKVAGTFLMSVKLPIFYRKDYRPLPMSATHVTKTELLAGCRQAMTTKK